MEGELRVDATRISKPLLLVGEQKRVLSPIKSQLPPIDSDNSNGQVNALGGHHYLDQSKDEVTEAMKHLWTEAQTVETQIQRGMDGLWQRMHDMMEYRTQEMHQQMEIVKSELTDSQTKLSRLTTQESALVQQNAKKSTQLTKEEKKRKSLEQNVSELKDKFETNQEELNGLSSRFKEREKVQKAEISKLQSQLEEKTSTLKDYQLKISRLTEKMNTLSKDWTDDKSSSEKQQKSTSDHLTHLTAENRKLILELSKLKGTLSSTSASLTTTREEKRKLEQQLHVQHQDHELSLSRLNKKHCTAIKELEEQIASLKKELESLNERYLIDTELLKKQLMETEKELAYMSTNAEDNKGDDFIEARIHFLRHQNKQEKVKQKQDKHN